MSLSLEWESELTSHTELTSLFGSDGWGKKAKLTKCGYQMIPVTIILSELMCGCASEQKQFPTIYKPKIDNKYNKFIQIC